MTGSELIAAERKRQIELEGWTAEHDDQHDRGQLAAAGAVYALTVDGPEKRRVAIFLDFWPWWKGIDPCLPAWWKPTPGDSIRQLVKAGALIAAEIDRLQRKMEVKHDQG